MNREPRNGSARNGSTDHREGDESELTWETTDRDTAYTCPGFDVVHDEVTLPDGTETVYDFVTEPPAVVVLPLTTDGAVVVIDEWRQAVGRVNRGLPAGTIEDGEGVLDAAERELAEETGHEAGGLERLLTVEPSNGIADSVHHHVLATGCTPTAEQALDADESIAVGTAELAALREAVLADELRDGRAATAVMAHALRDP